MICDRCGEVIEIDMHGYYCHSQSGSWGCEFGGPFDVATSMGRSNAWYIDYPDGERFLR